MAGKIHKLSALAVSKANKPGTRLSDGGNLYLRISMTGTKSWSFMYAVGGSRAQRGRQREIGLGPVHTISLADARSKATELRKMLIEGKDPMASKLQEKLDRARTITFAKAAETYINTHRAGWKQAKHAEKWQQSMELHVNPIIGRYSVATIDTQLVLKCLQPIWEEKTETATRVRGRIEKILDWCTVQKFRTGENPARWKGHLEHSLAAPNRIRNVEHFAALPYLNIGAFVRDLRLREGVSARMLELIILTAVRSGEARGATWGEFDLENAVWAIPAARMKMKKDHRIPLAKQAVDLMRKWRAEAGEPAAGDLVFPGPTEGKPYSDAVFLALYRRMKRDDITTHGFRSTFRDWAAETTAYPREVCEMALAHAISSAVEAAYRRGDLFAKRTRLMQEWADYCDKVIDGTSANVVPLRGTTAA